MVLFYYIEILKVCFCSKIFFVLNNCSNSTRTSKPTSLPHSDMYNFSEILTLFIMPANLQSHHTLRPVEPYVLGTLSCSLSVTIPSIRKWKRIQQPQETANHRAAWLGSAGEKTRFSFKVSLTPSGSSSSVAVRSRPIPLPKAHTQALPVCDSGEVSLSPSFGLTVVVRSCVSTSRAA